MNISRTQARSNATRATAARAAFSLIEVMIAMGLFFMAIFAILELTSRNLRAARSLQQLPPDIGGLAAEYANTNRLEEGSESGDFGDLYPGYSWNRETMLVGTNGLFEVDFTIRWTVDQRPVESKMDILLYRPESNTQGGRR